MYQINPIKTRAKANAVSTCSNWLWNFTVVMFTPPFTSASTFGCYLFFAIINALFIPTIYFFYPETAGRSLEEIDLIFAKVCKCTCLPRARLTSLPGLLGKHVVRSGVTPATETR